MLPNVVELVTCPICSKEVSALIINEHIDSSCTKCIGSSSQSSSGSATARIRQKNTSPTATTVAPIFKLNAIPGHRGADVQVSQSKASFATKRPAETEDTQPTKAAKRSKTAYLNSAAPLADRLRPTTLSEVIGQPHLTGLHSMFMNMLTSGSAGSMIFWGPPGCGKTTLARLIAKQTGAILKELSATGVGVHDVRAVLEEAKNLLILTGRQTMLFLDEVHRFNKGQQDILLPYVEQGHIQLVGATTENPSFRLSSALLSRCRVFVLERLTDEEMKTVILNAVKRALASAGPPARAPASSPTSTPETSQSSVISDGSECPCPSVPQLTPKILQSIISLAAGDARTAISLLDLVINSPSDSKEAVLLDSIRRCACASYDRTGESHYDMISALHKSVRGSQGSAAMYWLARMLTAGEDPLYIARRMIVCASEDIGLADSQALPLAVAALQACQTIGMPECRINLAHIVAYLSEAPKSIRAYEAYQRAEAAAKLDLTNPVPVQMRNAPTGLMKELGYGKEYRYNPAYAHPVHNIYLPLQFEGDKFLQDKDDRSGKIWNEDALRHWEHEVNDGKEWEGRGQI